jgi:hypothetical protein
VNDFQNLSDAELDIAYAAAFDANNGASVNSYAQEILTRLQTVGSFIEGVFGYTRFPLYNARGAFHQAQIAQSAMKESAVTLATDAAGAAQSAIWRGLQILAPVLVIGGVVFFYVYVKRK